MKKAFFHSILKIKTIEPNFKTLEDKIKTIPNFKAINYNFRPLFIFRHRDLSFIEILSQTL